MLKEDQVFERLSLMKRLFAGVLILTMMAFLAGCGGPEGQRGRAGKGAGRSDVTDAALKTYVPPGDLDEYYLFYSGGHSGQIFVSGVPSMRHICTIPVFFNIIVRINIDLNLKIAPMGSPCFIKFSRQAIDS